MRNDWVALAAKAREGDDEAFTALVERFKGPLLATIHTIVKDWHDTQDVAQEVFAAAYADLAKLRDARRFRAWLYQIARNRAVSRVREWKKAQGWCLERLEDEELIIGFPYAASCGIRAGEEPARGPSAAALERVRKTIGALPNGYGTLLVMRYVEGLSHEEMGVALERSPSSVKNVLYRARILARSHLRKAGIDLERVIHEM